MSCLVGFFLSIWYILKYSFYRYNEQSPTTQWTPFHHQNRFKQFPMSHFDMFFFFSFDFFIKNIHSFYRHNKQSPWEVKALRSFWNWMMLVNWSRMKCCFLWDQATVMQWCCLAITIQINCSPKKYHLSSQHGENEEMLHAIFLISSFLLCSLLHTSVPPSSTLISHLFHYP